MHVSIRRESKHRILSLTLSPWGGHCDVSNICFCKSFQLLLVDVPAKRKTKIDKLRLRGYSNQAKAGEEKIKE